MNAKEEAVWGFLRAHQDELLPVATAVLRGNVPAMASAAAKAFVTIKTGSGAAGTLAGGLAQRGAKTFGDWFADDSSRELQVEAAEYARMDGNFKAKFAFAATMKERLDDAESSFKQAIAKGHADTKALQTELNKREQALDEAMDRCLKAHHADQHKEAQEKAQKVEAEQARKQEQEALQAEPRSKVQEPRRRGFLGLGAREPKQEMLPAGLNPWSSRAKAKALGDKLDLGADENEVHEHESQHTQEPRHIREPLHHTREKERLKE